MSKRTSPAEPAVNDREAASNDESISNTGSAEIDPNTSEFDSESMEGESSLRKESGDLFRDDESGIEEIASESDSESDSHLSVEDIFEGEEELDETANESKSFSDADNVNDSAEYAQSPTDAMEADNTDILGNKSCDGVLEAKDGTKNETKSFFNAEQSGTEYPQSHKVLKMNRKKLGKKFTEGGLEIEDEQDKTGNDSKSSGKAAHNTTVSTQAPQSPTEALKALSISDSSGSSKTKSTPRQSKLKARTVNDIFDSPYNTRLKARLMRERESCGLEVKKD